MVVTKKKKKKPEAELLATPPKERTPTERGELQARKAEGRPLTSTDLNKDIAMRKEAQARQARSDVTARRVTATGEPIPLGAGEAETDKIIRLSPERKRAEEAIIAEAERQGLPPPQIDGEVIVGELPPETLPGITEQALVEEPSIDFAGETLTEDEIAMGMHSGSVSPLNADDLFNVATLGLGGGLITSVGKQVVGRKAIKIIGRKVFSSGAKKALGFIGVGVIGGIAGGVGGGIVKDILEGGATEVQGAINTVGQLATDSTEFVAQGITTPSQARADLDTLDSEILRMEADLKAGWISNKFLTLTKQIEDVNKDILDAKQQVINARNDILVTEIKDPDAIELAMFIEEKRRQYGVKMPTIKERIDIIQNA